MSKAAGPGLQGRVDAPVVCAISGKSVPRADAVNLDTLRPSLARRIHQEHPGLAPDAMISRETLTTLRKHYVEELLEAERGELSELERHVTESLEHQLTIAKNVEHEFAEGRTLGERLADGLASFGGSWTFLGAFAAVLFLWIAINIWLGSGRAFDTYPFILLNLILSCLAAVQAPIIMMSQKRVEAKDRLRALNDYQVNLKAELEIRHLHEKIDHLLGRQWERLAEIQQVQIEILEEARHSSK